MQKIHKFYQNFSKQLSLDREHIFQGRSARNRADLHGRGRFLLISKCDWALQALWPALPAPTVPRRRSYSRGMGRENREGGAILGVAFFRLLCSFNERAQLPKDTSTSPAQLLPSSRPALKHTCAQGETCISFVASYFKCGYAPWGAFGFRGLQIY